MDHLSTTSFSTLSSGREPKQPGIGNAANTSAMPTAAGLQLSAGKAVTLRAKQLSVLRIMHGRTWVTVTDVGPYSRVTGGDHFLSRGDSLTLLPGQELVMETFGIGHETTARFSFEAPCAAAAAPALVATSPSAEVLEPLRDLRHALGLAGVALGRVLMGLGRSVWLGGGMILTRFAMVFVATGEDCTRAKRPVDV